MTISDWKTDILKQYPSNSTMLAANSMAARGARKVGREQLGKYAGPRGGKYIVFGPTTHAQRHPQGKKRR